MAKEYFCVSNCELDYPPTWGYILSSLHPQFQIYVNEQGAIDAERNDFLKKRSVERCQPEAGESFSPIFLRIKVVFIGLFLI